MLLEYSGITDSFQNYENISHSSMSLGTDQIVLEFEASGSCLLSCDEEKAKRRKIRLTYRRR